MNAVKEDINLIGRCGLYCGACGKYLKGRCPGCNENEKASWCKVRSCTLEKGILSCADCDEFADVSDCRKYNNFMAKAFGFVFNSDRKKCIDEIKNIGYEKFTVHMTENRIMTFKRK